MIKALPWLVSLALLLLALRPVRTDAPGDDRRRACWPMMTNCHVRWKA